MVDCAYLSQIAFLPTQHSCQGQLFTGSISAALQCCITRTHRDTFTLPLCDVTTLSKPTSPHGGYGRGDPHFAKASSCHRLFILPQTLAPPIVTPPLGVLALGVPPSDDRLLLFSLTFSYSLP